MYSRRIFKTLFISWTEMAFRLLSCVVYFQLNITQSLNELGMASVNSPYCIYIWYSMYDFVATIISSKCSNKMIIIRREKVKYYFNFNLKRGSVKYADKFFRHIISEWIQKSHIILWDKLVESRVTSISWTVKI